MPAAGGWLMLLCAPALGATVSLATGPAAGMYSVTGEFEAAAPPETAWEVLTDYDGIAKFVSSVKRSRVLRRDGGETLIEQEGVGRFFFFSRSVKLTLRVREVPPGRVEFQQADGGPFKTYEGAWEIRASSAGCSVAYRLLAQPGPTLGPRFAVKGGLRADARRRLDEVRREIERRGRL